MHGVYLGGVFVAIRLGLEAGLSALIVSLQPLLVAAAAPFVLDERLAGAAGSALASGMLGAGLVLSGKLGHGGSELLGGRACVAALGGITVGTLYQKRRVRRSRSAHGNLIQFAAAVPPVAASPPVRDPAGSNGPAGFVFALPGS